MKSRTRREALASERRHRRASWMAHAAQYEERKDENKSLFYRATHDSLTGLNDAHSHQAGDGALQYLTRKLQESCRTSDVVARLGGDEFGVLFAKVGDEKTALALYPEDGPELDELIEAADAEIGPRNTRRRRDSRAAAAAARRSD
jgi:GGDEF domain-containing protein